MDFGLSDQQKLIVRRARAHGLPGARRCQVLMPLWLIALASLLLFLLVFHPSRYLALLLIPPLGFWHRQRVEQRLLEWALDLRESHRARRAERTERWHQSDAIRPH